MYKDIGNATLSRSGNGINIKLNDGTIFNISRQKMTDVIEEKSVSCVVKTWDYENSE